MYTCPPRGPLSPCKRLRGDPQMLPNRTFIKWIFEGQTVQDSVAAARLHPRLGCAQVPGALGPGRPRDGGSGYSPSAPGGLPCPRPLVLFWGHPQTPAGGPPPPRPHAKIILKYRPKAGYESWGVWAAAAGRQEPGSPESGSAAHKWGAAPRGWRQGPLKRSPGRPQISLPKSYLWLPPNPMNS